MKKLLYVLPLVGILIFSSCDRDDSNQSEETIVKDAGFSIQDAGWDYNYPIATTTKELSLLMDDPKANIVRSEADFKRFVASEPLLKKVFSDVELYKKVVGSMKFNERGLKTYSYEAVRKAYPNEFRRIIAAIGFGFGFDETLGIDYDGKECSSPATCTSKQSAICIGDNC
ncbi:hypothetical protein GCM10022393_24720 [Aquimarina addita]|uniref:Uncharacterized protein n=1 Tax=Aquimarina addita TaxID=870485 RepID=A0ABP6UNB3_9FLAO